MPRHNPKDGALPATPALLQLVLDTIPARVFWKDRELRYLGCNRVCARDAGLAAPAEIVGKNDFDLSWKNQAELYRADDRHVIDSGEPKLNYVEPQTGPDGKSLWLRTSKIPLRNEMGEIIGVMGTYEDITLQRQLEEQLLHAQKMESVGRLAGGVAHDLNNLLSPILGYSGLVLSAMPQDAPYRDELSEILRAGERSRELIQQLLAVGRKQAMELKVLDVRDVVAKAEKILRQMLREDIRIEVHTAPTPRLVRADVGRLEDVLINLALNAQDAMAQGGVLSISLDEVTPAHAEIGMPTGPCIMLCVSDTGSGMDAETLSLIFEPFFTTKEIGKGTGLGLSVVYGVVKQHGGHIAVSSRPGQGTTFKITLPRMSEPAQAVAPAAVGEPAVKTGSGVVLVVEDNEMVRTLVCRALSAQGYSVVEAPTAMRCLELMTTQTALVDLLLTDVIMPSINGPDLYARLRQRWPVLKVVYMSGYDRSVLGPHGVLKEGILLIQKPFTLEMLNQTVRKALAD